MIHRLIRPYQSLRAAKLIMSPARNAGSASVRSAAWSTRTSPGGGRTVVVDINASLYYAYNVMAPAACATGATTCGSVGPGAQPGLDPRPGDLVGRAAEHQAD